jgi:hypothetical protein
MYWWFPPGTPVSSSIKIGNILDKLANWQFRGRIYIERLQKMGRKNVQYE